MILSWRILTAKHRMKIISPDMQSHDAKYERATSGFTQACDKIKETVEHYRDKGIK